MDSLTILGETYNSGDRILNEYLMTQIMSHQIFLCCMLAHQP